MNKIRTHELVAMLAACVAIILTLLMPFYVTAQENANNSTVREEMICGGEGEYLQIVKVNKFDEAVELEKPDYIVLNDRGENKVYLVEKMDCNTFLENAGVEITSGDIVSLPVNTILENNSVVNVDRIEYKTEIRSEIVKHGVKETGIDTIPKGTREVISEGKDGLSTRTYLVKYVNGKAVEEAVYSESVIVEPVDEIANVGIGGTVTAKDGTVYHYSYRKQMEATAYTYLPPYTTMTTATGQTLRKGIVAVDPRVIPLHTKMFITGSVEYGYGIAEDTGGAIKGNIIDLAYMSYDECIQFGRRQMQVYILE